MSVARFSFPPNPGPPGGGVKRGHGLGFGPLFLPEHWPESASSWHTQPGPQAQLLFGAPEGKGSAGAVACDVWSERRLRSGRGSLSREAGNRAAREPRGGVASAGHRAHAHPLGQVEARPASGRPKVGEGAVAGSTSYPARDTALRWASLRWESRSEFLQARPGWKGSGGGGGPGVAGLQSGWKDSKWVIQGANNLPASRNARKRQPAPTRHSQSRAREGRRDSGTANPRGRREGGRRGRGSPTLLGLR
ncbi:uncharacterized protein LOC112610137 [Theropithecus gelada]|uniref:uncharacterized protein LOC112610137 n=1 Tax=Theropithecus gelada TaxID=9565 RepID=UPI000DC1A797|nr:uncharacterized protein LOC112610137 [Theropithecus gelada]